jgi:hypothetical protein
MDDRKMNYDILQKLINLDRHGSSESLILSLTAREALYLIDAIRDSDGPELVNIRERIRASIKH